MAKKKKEARQVITLECTEARALGKSPSRYSTMKNKKNTPKRLEAQEVQSKPSSSHHPQRNQVIFLVVSRNPGFGWGFAFSHGALWGLWNVMLRYGQAGPPQIPSGSIQVFIRIPLPLSSVTTLSP